MCSSDLAHAEKHDVAFELGRTAQFGRDQDAAGAVEIDVRRAPKQKPLQGARGVRQPRDPLALRFPRRPRIDEQAAVRVAGEGQAAVTARRQGIAVTAGHGKSPFAVQRQL